MRQHKNENHLYERDFYKWAFTQAELLKNGQLEKIDLENIIEEIECLGRSEKNALKSQMIRLLKHLLKIEFQPKKHTKSWDNSISQARLKIDRNIDENPSLKRELEKVMKEAFPYAVKEASIETSIDIKKFPKECPWTLKEVMGI